MYQIDFHEFLFKEIYHFYVEMTNAHLSHIWSV